MDAGDRSDQDLIKIFDGLDEMALPQNDVAPFWKCQADRFQVQGVLLSSQNIGHQFSGNIRQAEMASLKFISQLLMIDTQAMQDRGLQVMDVDRIFDDIVAVVVRLAIDDSSLHAASSQPHREATRMMVSPVIGLG